MSVILGQITPHRIVLCADRRIVATVNDEDGRKREFVHTDNESKLFSHGNLGIIYAGSSTINGFPISKIISDFLFFRREIDKPETLAQILWKHLRSMNEGKSTIIITAGMSESRFCIVMCDTASGEFQLHYSCELVFAGETGLLERFINGITLRIG